MDYKYTTTFESPLLACEINESSLISQASLDNLAPLVPTDIDYDSNIDLLGVAFNAAVVNKFNKNGDGMDTSTALKYTKNFVHKPTNIEHDKQKVVGHIASAGFSEYGSSKLLSDEEVKNKKNPFNIALGAVIYKSVNKNFTDLVERSIDPSDSAYQKVSASWEVGFSDYVLAVGSNDLEEARIISDPSKIEEMKGFLRSYGGSGKTQDGESIFRLITGDIYPLGIAYTLNPAADVKGLYSESDDTAVPFINDKRDKISQNNKINVNTKKDIIAMEIENTISELKELLNEKKFNKEAVASMTDTFAQAIKERDEQYRKDIEAAESAKESAVKEHEELKSSVAELEEKLGAANERISAFENDKKAEEAVARFNERMDDLDQKFELDDQDREFLANELKEVGDEEAYASFAGKLEVLWKHKNKEAQAAFNAEIQERIDEEVAKRVSTASTEEVEVEEALDAAEATDAPVANANEAVASKEPTLREKFRAAFTRDNIEIS
tara:strand:+ start:1205 stop:2695 length:1491 start_codon:yes stop_codon:yes gene_type:complete